ncbi:MAG: hypothetical protein D6725_16810 [Planctomycetota bacterium]|nr:MAG: hypothetical protein D6725_16810 [Planctomycetota bacterium]
MRRCWVTFIGCLIAGCGTLPQRSASSSNFDRPIAHAPLERLASSGGLPLRVRGPAADREFPDTPATAARERPTRQTGGPPVTVAGQSPPARGRRTPHGPHRATDDEFARLLAEELSLASPAERERLRQQLTRLDRHLALLVLRNRRKLRELGRDAVSGRRLPYDVAASTSPHGNGRAPGGYALRWASGDSADSGRLRADRATSTSAEPRSSRAPDIAATGQARAAHGTTMFAAAESDSPRSRGGANSDGSPRAGRTSVPTASSLSAPDPRLARRATPRPSGGSSEAQAAQPIQLLGIAPRRPRAALPPLSQPRPTALTTDSRTERRTPDAPFPPPGDGSIRSRFDSDSSPPTTPPNSPPRERPPEVDPLETPPFADAESSPPDFATGRGEASAYPAGQSEGDATTGSNDPQSGRDESPPASPESPSRWPSWVLDRARQMRHPALALPALPTVEPRTMLRPLERPVAELAGILGGRGTSSEPKHDSDAGGSRTDGSRAVQSAPAPSDQLLKAWQEALDRAEAALRAIPPGQGATKRRRTAAEVRLRFLALLANRPDVAMTPIPNLPADEQEFWQKLLWGTANALAFVAADDRKQAEPELLEALAALEAAVGLLAERAPLTLANVTFCHRIDSYGSYEPFEESVFRPGQPVLLYAELKHFRSEATDDGRFRSAVDSVITIRGPDGELVDRIDFPLTEDLCRHRRRDYFLSYQFTMPRSVRLLGPHTLELHVRDALSGRETRAELRFSLE